MRRENTFYTKYSLTGGNADCTFNYERNGDLVLSGDWDADGKDTLAVRRGSTYYIKNMLAIGIADSSFITVTQKIGPLLVIGVVTDMMLWLCAVAALSM